MGKSKQEKRYSCAHMWFPITCTWDKVDTLGTKQKLFREIVEHFKVVSVTLKQFLNSVLKETNAEISSRKRKKKKPSLRNSHLSEASLELLTSKILIPSRTNSQYKSDFYIDQLSLTCKKRFYDSNSHRLSYKGGERSPLQL